MYQYHHQFLNISSDRIFIFLFASIPSFSEFFHNLSRFFFFEGQFSEFSCFFARFFHDFSWFFMVCFFMISYGFSWFFHVFSMFFHGFSMFFSMFVSSEWLDLTSITVSPASESAAQVQIIKVLGTPSPQQLRGDLMDGFGWWTIGMTPSGYLTYMYIYIVIYT